MINSPSGWKNGHGGQSQQQQQQQTQQQQQRHTMVVAAEDVAGVVGPDSGDGGGAASSSYPPGGGQAQTGPHFFARGSTRQAVSLPTTSPLGFLRSKSSGSASLKPSNGRTAGIESERGLRAPVAAESAPERPGSGGGGRSSGRNSGGALRRVESERMYGDDDSGGSLQSSPSSTDLACDDEYGLTGACVCVCVWCCSQCVHASFCTVWDDEAWMLGTCSTLSSTTSSTYAPSLSS
jgi:hypothetical protein